jgi:hypothetical protein
MKKKEIKLLETILENQAVLFDYLTLILYNSSNGRCKVVVNEVELNRIIKQYNIGETK